MFEISAYTGDAARPFLGEVARLRIAVFREFPYLYEGSTDYEMEYLSNYYSSEKSLLITAKEDSVTVGISTAVALADADPEFREPIIGAGLDPGKILYFGESVLLPEFRGKGIGHRFFDLREEWARRWGFPITAFCAVSRPPGHPSEPKDYRPLDSFWESRGYRKRDDLVVRLPWKEVGGSDQETDHELIYWLRESP
jgi:GNAT superfamily N-acetyltransferase